jgi:two-component system KDP operon response regulator KdpE
VLVAEDDSELRAAVVEYLRAEGFEVSEAHGGTTALEAARADPPDVLILDLNMPDKDGSEVLADWTTHQDLQNVPVVLVSAGAELTEVAQEFAVRASLAKPFDMDVLRAVIEQLIAHPQPPPEAKLD